MGLGGLMKDFSGWTSAHGIPQIGAARTQSLRISWVLIFFGSLVMFIYQLSVIIKTYLAYGVTVSTVLKFEERTFPSVTICSSNPFKRSKTAVNSHLEYLFSNYSLALDYPNWASEPHLDYHFLSTANNSIGVGEKARLNLLYIESQLADSDKDKMTYSLDDLVLECGYEGVPCDMEKDFRKVYDPIFGACYEYNFDGSKTNTRSGRGKGLELLLKNEQAELLPITEHTASVITVHSQNKKAFPDAFGYITPVGMTMDISVTMTKTERLPTPYGDCTEGQGTETFYYEGMDYSEEACYRSCIQRIIVADCNCADPRFVLPPGTSYCTINDDACLEKYRIGPKLDGSYSEKYLSDCEACTQPCNDILYGAISSVQIWPAGAHLPRECAIKSLQDESAGEECRHWYNHNTMKVFVFYDVMTYRSLIEDPAYTVTNIILNLGGQLGLWVGYSVITIVEFFSLIGVIAIYFFAKQKGPNISDMSDIDVPGDTGMQDIERILKEKHGIGSDSEGEDEDEDEKDSTSSDESSDTNDDSSDDEDTVDPYQLDQLENFIPPPVALPLS